MQLADMILKRQIPFCYFLIQCGVRLANAGYAVFGIDYEGHGRSRGARCYIKKFENIVNDCNEFFKSICAEEEYKDKCRFLYGESMGGAVALLLHKKEPTFWNGAVLVAPMCKISEKVKPHPLVINVLTRVEEIIPKWKIVPTKDVIDSAFKDPVKREEIRSNKLIYQDKPRLKTALEMLRTSMSLEHTLHEVDIITWLEKHTNDDNSVIVQPIHTYRNAILKMNTTASPPQTINKQHQQQSPRPVRTQSHRRYFCGLKGRRLQHHSAM
ncbi:hypothetical protein GBA52_027971 [Prunus armeniaca]|nr:hypothetical protein GBA52_027971 [Prunus armeniaca]